MKKRIRNNLPKLLSSASSNPENYEEGFSWASKWESWGKWDEGEKREIENLLGKENIIWNKPD